MIFLVLIIMAAIAVVVTSVRVSAKRAEPSDDERTLELLKKTRLMFPSAEDNIFALDALYQSTYRELLVTQEENKADRKTLKHDLILIFNAKNKAIIEAVQFEESSANVVPTAQGTPQ
ncbi:MAG TPA: hypothetical protein VL633_12825 [Bacteroidota bacterium]|jgi:hypothetical protein|nr:hypothetical protein [Bacteroidota bacterium]